MTEIKTVSDLKRAVEQADPETPFFCRTTMRFFGDTMRNYGVRLVTIRVRYDDKGNYIGKEGTDIQAYELYRRRGVKSGLHASAYFRADNFRWTTPCNVSE